jgi:hypothetical protein
MAGSLFTFNFNEVIKKIILHITFTIIVIFLLDFTIGRTLRYLYFKEKSGLHFRTTNAMEITKADILVFGTSRANHHYVPEVFEDSLGMTFYNTGRDGTGIFYHNAVLKSVLLRYKPKIIILDFSTIRKENKDYDKLSSLLPYYKTHKEIRKIVELKSPLEKIKFISEIYPFNSEILTILIGNLEMNKNRKPDNNGYIPLYHVWNKKIDSTENKLKYPLDSNKSLAFQDFIKTAKTSGAMVFVIYSPIFQDFNNDQEIDLSKNICENEKIPFWNYSKDTSFINNCQLFHDAIHLNYFGATKFSKLIASKIKHYIENKTTSSN